MDAKPQTTFHSFDTKLGTYALKKVFKKISTSASRQLQIDQAQQKIRTNKWDPSTQSLRNFTTAFSDLKSILSNIPHKPLSSQYRRWWITLLPPVQRNPISSSPLKQYQRNYRSSRNNTDRNWYTDPCLPQFKPKEHPKSSRISQHDRSTIPPSVPATTSELPPWADDSRRYPMPTTIPTSKDFCTHIRVESRAGNTQAQLQIKYATPHAHGCWLCRFKQGDKAFHTDSECNLLKIFYPYLSTINVYPSVHSTLVSHIS